MQGSSPPDTAAERPPREEGPRPGEPSLSTDWLGGAGAAFVGRLKRIAAHTARQLGQAPATAAQPTDERPEGDGKARIVLTGARTSKLVRPPTKPQ